METYTHTCSNCADEKEIILRENESADDLDGCVCDRTVERFTISADSLTANLR